MFVWNITKNQRIHTKLCHNQISFYNITLQYSTVILIRDDNDDDDDECGMTVCVLWEFHICLPTSKMLITFQMRMESSTRFSRLSHVNNEKKTHSEWS